MKQEEKPKNPPHLPHFSFTTFPPSSGESKAPPSHNHRPITGQNSNQQPITAQRGVKPAGKEEEEEGEEKRGDEG
ncbi:hypothetical protein F7725_010965 [Dissostichus mawsoni]|uniref:Uncharacterized protein n=1 Tax=Dissostichus mawsoni TaxID=36200 RepID=A0A7J5Z7H7_DISMA|nr:hypothetical protein F7725_010965 [Dissostichus mawsoni]